MSTNITYKQADSKWGSDPFPGGADNLANSGCGPTSIATVLANAGGKHTPKVVGKYMNKKGYAIAGAGSSHGGMTETLKHFGVKNVKMLSSPNWSDVETAKGYGVLLFRGGSQGGVTWTSAGHYVATTGYRKKGNKHEFYVRDPGGRNNDGWFCYENTMSSLLIYIWICPVDGQALNGGDDGDWVDDGRPIVLKEQIATLYTSDNFSFIEKEQKEEWKSGFVTSFKDSFLKYNPPGTENNILTYKENKSKLVSISDALTKLLEGIKQEAVKITNERSQGVESVGTLESFTTLVEAPTIVLNLNGTTIGGYGNEGDVFPNYITSMQVSKISGQINQYTINLRYTVRFGEDPNFIDKLVSKTGFTNKIQILYGDSASTKLFRDDEAIITDVTFNESVSSKTIDYTITALSSIISATSATSNYAAKTDKPSNLINDLLYSNNTASKSLLEALPGMASKTLVASAGLIPTNDAVVQTQTHVDASPLSQLEYYVDGMYNPQSNSNYYLTFMDDTQNEFGGPYLKISEIGSASTETMPGRYFEVDVGYPGENFVMDFVLNTDTYFPLVYKYNGNFPQWNYDIDDYGNIISNQSNPLVANNDFNQRNVIQSNWWNKVTEYPVSAQLRIKGLVKPLLITSYIKINTLFYGNEDLASGLYAVLGQTDSISGAGYTTTLDLLRVGVK